MQWFLYFVVELLFEKQVIIYTYTKENIIYHIIHVSYLLFHGDGLHVCFSKIDCEFWRYQSKLLSFMIDKRVTDSSMTDNIIVIFSNYFQAMALSFLAFD